MNFRIGDIMEETRKVKGAISLELTFNEPYFNERSMGGEESIKKYEIPFEKLKPIERELLIAAKNAMENAYNPYSHFYVGAAVLTRSGNIIVGANSENASYGNTLCAERTALFAANVQGYRDIIALATIARGEDFDTEVPSAPCGLCRQAIIEFAQISNQNIEVIFSNSKMTRIAVIKIKDLLPFAFGPGDLNIDLGKFRR